MKAHLLRVVTACGVVLSTASPGLAHHFFPRASDTPVSVVGTVVRFQMVNPHSRLLLDVRDASGNVATWDIELGSVQALMARGWTRDSVRPGDVIAAEVIMWKGHAHAGSARTVELPDGSRVFAGSHAGDYGRR